VLAAALWSNGARADEPVAPEADNVNPSALPPRAAQPNLILIGGAITLGWYGAAVGTSYIWSDSDAAKWLRIPVAGPFVAFAHEPCVSRETNCSTVSVVVRTVFTVFSAVGQVGGVVGILEGAFLPTSTTAPAASGAPLAPAPDHAGHAARIAVAPLPMGVNGAGLGLGIEGAF